MTVLTPAIASRMLDVWERRKRHPRETVYDSSVLEAALGLPDHLPVHRSQNQAPRFVKEVNGKWVKVR